MCLGCQVVALFPFRLESTSHWLVVKIKSIPLSSDLRIDTNLGHLSALVEELVLAIVIASPLGD